MDVEGTYRKHTWQEPWNSMGKKSLPMKAYSKKFFFSKSILSYPPLPSWSGYGILCKIHRLELLLINVPINPYQLLFFLYTPPLPPSQKKKEKKTTTTKHQETRCFLMFSGRKEVKHWTKISQFLIWC